MTPNPLTTDLEELNKLGGDLWNDLRGASIFVTGGTGFFGRWLLESFAHVNRTHRLKATLTVLTRNPDRFRHAAPHLATDSAIRLHYGDIRNFAPPTGHFTHMIHAATDSSSGSHGNALHMADTILSGTRNLLDFAHAQGTPRVLYVSSGAVYGHHRPGTMAETDSTAPALGDANLAYSEAKRMAEALCTLYAAEYGIPISIARGFAFVGPHLPLHAHFAIGNFIRDALAGNTIAIQSDGTAIRSYLYASDLARWLWTILLRGRSATAYNVGAAESVTIAELAARVAEQVNPQTSISIAGIPSPGAALAAYVPNIARAKAELGLTPSIGLDEAIRRTAAWHRHLPATAATPAIPPILAAPDAVIFDFDGVMTDNRVALSQNGTETVFCNRSDGLGIEQLRKAGIPMLILSKEKNPVVSARARKLRIPCLQGIDEKQAALETWLGKNKYRASHTIYLGNDINDLSCMKMVGLPVAVADAYPEAKAAASIVLTRAGGHGAVRELADKILAARG